MGHITRYLGLGLQHIFLGGHCSIPSNPLNAWGIKQIFSGLPESGRLFLDRLFLPCGFHVCATCCRRTNCRESTSPFLQVQSPSELGWAFWYESEKAAVSGCILTRTLVWERICFQTHSGWKNFLWGYGTGHCVPAGGHLKLTEATFST